MTQYIKAPFNFVPLNDKVFFPDWADEISHDIPFEDGESGTIELELTAMTPIFVRNGHTKEDADLKEKSDAYTSFSKDQDGNYFIPATSVKGMIRNVLEIISFGKMRIKGEYSQKEIKDLNLKKYLPNYHIENLPDLSDCIFGFTTKENDMTSLKGRVQFSHAFCSNNEDVNVLPLKTMTLAEPKPSYYPIYICQKEHKQNKGIVAGSYKTYDDSNSILKGWKRYPVHSDFVLPLDSKYKTPSDEKKQASKFIPIERAKFNVKIRFQNLRSSEIGGLFSALTFHKTENCFHSIGSAKAYGYGKLKVSGIKYSGRLNFDEYLIAFEKAFNNDVHKKFPYFDLKNSDEIKELILMAQNQINSRESELRYMSLDNKEFANVKKNHEFLRYYSQLKGVDYKSVINGSKEYSLMNKKNDEQKEKEQQKSEEAIEKLGLERLRKAAEEKRILDERIETERLRIEAEEKARQEKRANEIVSGLVFLVSIKDFDSSKGRIDQWMKKANVNLLPAAQHNYLSEAVNRFYNEAKIKEKLKWREPFASSPIWKKISTWIGNETAKNWYEGMIGK